MDESAFNDWLAQQILQLGLATPEQLEHAQQALAEHPASTLADVLVLLDVITDIQLAELRRTADSKEATAGRTALFSAVPDKDNPPASSSDKYLGPYRLTRKLGAGTMGVVFLAHDTENDRDVALKVLPKQNAADPAVLRRFTKEAKTTCRMKHPNLVGGYGIGECGGHHFYAMEYCGGEPLELRLRRGPLPPAEAARVVCQAAQGLRHAHRLGILHRDIKPANILLDVNGCAKLSDLGLSKDTSEDASATQSGYTVGTPHYIAPEQARGDRDTDARADIYSLGATFFHLITGRPPYDGATAAVVMAKHLTDTFPDPRTVVPELPEDAAWVIERMTAKLPADRYVGCDELIADLRILAEGGHVEAHAVTESDEGSDRAQSSIPRRAWEWVAGTVLGRPTRS